MKKNILIIDDSALMRRVISDIIKTDDRFYVTGLASDGLEALGMISKNPKSFDVIVLDINMPKMNGIQFLEELSRLKIEVKVIVVSAIAQESAVETIRALELGAFDFIKKPTDILKTSENSFRRKIIKCLELAVEDTDSKHYRRSIARTQNRPITINNQQIYSKKEKEGSVKKGLKLVALACSTGGPKALQQVVPNLPANLNTPVLIVQHMPAGFTKSLAARLDEMSKIKVKEAEDGERIEQGVVYIAKGGCQMRVKQDSSGQHRLSVTVEGARNGLKPCADIMYESLVDTNYEEITCVILTGMGGDGTQGIKQLNQKNKIYAIAQNAETCTVYGMPKVFAQSGLADEVLPIEEIADAIRKHVGVQ